MALGWHWAGSGGALGPVLVAGDAAALCVAGGGTWRHPPSFHVAGVALGGIHLGFAWQAWHLATSTVVSRGRSGTWSHPPSFCVAGVALGDIHLGLYKNPVSFLITQNHVIVVFFLLSFSQVVSSL